MAVALREAFDGKAVVLTPDLPRHPKEALKLVRKIIDKEQPDLLIGNSCGAFLAQMLAPMVGVPFDCCSPYYRERVWGLFGENDPIAHFSSLFAEHYSHIFHFPGDHTPTPAEVKTWYAPLAENLMKAYPKKDERLFQHFKGGKYKFIHSAFDSETLERMVVYQALYGDEAYWVRPEKMFFGKVTRDGKTFNRFTEID